MPAKRTNTSERAHRWRAHRAVAWAVSTGALIPQGCEVCEAPADAHHDSYDRPLDVRWLCDHHHRLHHAMLARSREREELLSTALFLLGEGWTYAEVARHLGKKWSTLYLAFTRPA